MFYFLALPDAPDSSFIFSVPVLESAIFPRSSGSFHWRMELETKIWALCMFVATGVLFLFQFSFNLVSALGYVENVIFIVGTFQLFRGLFQEINEGGVLFPAPGMPLPVPVVGWRREAVGFLRLRSWSWTQGPTPSVFHVNVISFEMFYAYL